MYEPVRCGGKNVKFMLVVFGFSLYTKGSTCVLTLVRVQLVDVEYNLIQCVCTELTSNVLELLTTLLC